MKARLVLMALIGLLLSLPTQAQRVRDYDQVEQYLRSNSTQSNEINWRQVNSMQRASEQRAERFANELANYSTISNSNDPARVLQQYQQQREKMEQFIAQRNEQLVRQGFDAVSKLSNLNSSSSTAQGVDAVGSTIQSISEAYEANQAAKAQRARLERQRVQAMRQIANDIIEQNNEMIREYIGKAAYALNPDEEDFYMRVAYYFNGHNTHIQSNFSSANTRWASNPYKEPEKPVLLPNNLKSKYEKYMDAADRKIALYYKNGRSFNSLYEAAVKFANGAIHENKNSHQPYMLLAEITKENDKATSYSSLLIAKKISKSGFQQDGGSEMLDQQREAFTADFVSKARANDIEGMQEAINLGLHRGLTIDGKNVTGWAIAQDQADLLQLIINREVQDNGRDNDRLAAYLAQAAYENADQCVSRLVRLGVDPDISYKRTKPVYLASRAGSLEALKVLYEASNEQSSYTNFFMRPSNAPYAVGYMQWQLEERLQSNDQLGAEPYVQYFVKNRKAQPLLKSVTQVAQSQQNPRLVQVLDPLAKAAPAGIGNDVFLESINGGQTAVAEELYLTGLTKFDFRLGSQTSTRPEKKTEPESSSTTTSTSNSNTSAYSSGVKGMAEYYVDQGIYSSVAEGEKYLRDAYEQTASSMDMTPDEMADLALQSMLSSASTSSSSSSSTYTSRQLSTSILNNPLLSKVVESDMDRMLVDLSNKGFFRGEEKKIGEAITRASARRCLERFPQLGLSYRTKDEQGFNVAHHVAYLGDTTMMGILIRKDPDLIDSEGGHGWTPLHIAARENDFDMVEYLYIHDAVLNYEDEWGRTPKDIAEEYAEKIGSYDRIVEYL